MRFSRFRYLLLPALVGASVPLLAPPAAAQMSPEDVRVGTWLGTMVDLQPEVDNPTDGTTGAVLIVTSPERTAAVFGLGDADPALAGAVHGVHVHTGPCRQGDPEAVGPHLQSEPPPSDETEIWLDVTFRPEGWAVSYTSVPFGVTPDEVRSVVVHARPTDESGAAGEPLACLPLE